jgi:hypothetical protein
MFDAAAQLAKLYRKLGDQVTPAVGLPFLAIFSAADVDRFDGMAQIGDYQIRYVLADASLAVGSLVTISGQQYRVVADPARSLDGREAFARLVEYA